MRKLLLEENDMRQLLNRAGLTKYADRLIKENQEMVSEEEKKEEPVKEDHSEESEEVPSKEAPSAPTNDAPPVDSAPSMDSNPELPPSPEGDLGGLEGGMDSIGSKLSDEEKQQLATDITNAVASAIEGKLGVGMEVEQEDGGLEGEVGGDMPPMPTNEPPMGDEMPMNEPPEDLINEIARRVQMRLVKIMEAKKARIREAKLLEARKRAIMERKLAEQKLAQRKAAPRRVK